MPVILCTRSGCADAEEKPDSDRGRQRAERRAAGSLLAGWTARSPSRSRRDTLAKVGAFQPDLILLDVMMPKLSGFEVCKKLKADPATRGIMILMVTALNELGDIERAVDAGTDDFLSKPVNKLELLKRVENMLKLPTSPTRSSGSASTSPRWKTGQDRPTLAHGGGNPGSGILIACINRGS